MEQNVDKLFIGDKEIILIGTAHVSPKSVELVKETIENEKPDSVCIELDENRYQTMENKKGYQDTDIIKIIKDGKSSLFLVNLILSSYQRKMADQFGIQSGQEMIQAVSSAQECGADLTGIFRRRLNGSGASAVFGKRAN